VPPSSGDRTLVKKLKVTFSDEGGGSAQSASAEEVHFYASPEEKKQGRCSGGKVGKDALQQHGGVIRKSPCGCLLER